MELVCSVHKLDILTWGFESGNRAVYEQLLPILLVLKPVQKSSSVSWQDAIFYPANSQARYFNVGF